MMMHLLENGINVRDVRVFITWGATSLIVFAKIKEAPTKLQNFIWLTCVVWTVGISVIQSPIELPTLDSLLSHTSTSIILYLV